MYHVVKAISSERTFLCKDILGISYSREWVAMYLLPSTSFHIAIFSHFRAWLMTMDYVQKFDIEIDKENYYAGEVVTGKVVVITTENIKVKGNTFS